MSSDEPNVDSSRSNEDDVMVPSSQNSDGHLLSYHEEFQSRNTPKGLSEEDYIPFSRPSFEDGFCDIGPSQNIELQITDSHRVEDDAAIESLDTESPEKVYVRETSVESQLSAAPCVDRSRVEENGATGRGEEEEETELSGGTAVERTLTICPPGDSVTPTTDNPEVDLDGSNSSGASEDITALPIASVAPSNVEMTHGAKKRPREDSSLAFGELEAKKRARTQEPASSGSSSPSVTLAAPKAPSPAESSVHTSPGPNNGPGVVAMPFFVRFGVDVFNSVEQQQRFHRDIVVPGNDLSVRRFQVTCDVLIASLCQFFASAGIPISPQSSLTTTTPSDSDSVGYLGDMSGSSGGGGGGGLASMSAANSFLSLPSRRSSAVSFHAPSAHDLLRSAGSAPLEFRPAAHVTTDPSRRSDVASNAFSFPPGSARSSLIEFAPRHFSSIGPAGELAPRPHSGGGGILRRRRTSVEGASTDDHFKVPGAPLGRLGRHSGSSCSSGPEQDLSLDGGPEPRTSLAPPCVSSSSEPSSVPASAPNKTRRVGESGYQSSSDIFDESRPLAKIQEDPEESDADAGGRESSSSSSSLREAARRLEEDPFENMRASRSSVKTSQPSSADATVGPRGAKDIDTDTNTVYRVDAPEMPVYARWKNERFFYAGVVIGTKLSKDKLKVLFDDNSEADVRTHDILMMELLPEGTTVSADTSSSGLYEHGFRILRHVDRPAPPPPTAAPGRRQQTPRGYVVRHLGSERELSLARGRVAIALEDAHSLLLSHGAPGTPVADVSLENIVHTKRQPKEKRLRASWVATPPPVERLRRSNNQSGGSPRASRSPRASAQGSPSRGGGRRKERAAGSGQTPRESGETERNPASASTEQLGGDDTSISETSASGETFSSMTWPTQRFTMSSSAGEVQGPLFANFTFLITCPDGGSVATLSRVDSPSRRQNQSSRPFNRDLLRNSIEERGGRIVDAVTEELLAEEGARLVLVASEANRTAKFLQCLAASVPCVRFTWVLESLAEGVLQPFTAYRLPRGVDWITGEEIPWKENMEAGHGSDIFSGAAVAILTDDAAVFGSNWERILTLAGAVAQVLPLSAARTGRLERFRVVLVDEKRCSAFSLHQMAQRRACPPVVNHHFFVQSLLHARMLDPHSESAPFQPHPKDSS